MQVAVYIVIFALCSTEDSSYQLPVYQLWHLVISKTVIERKYMYINRWSRPTHLRRRLLLGRLACPWWYMYDRYIASICIYYIRIEYLYSITSFEPMCGISSISCSKWEGYFRSQQLVKTEYRKCHFYCHWCCVWFANNLAKRRCPIRALWILTMLVIGER